LRGSVFCERSAAAAANYVLLLIIIEKMPRQQQLAAANVSNRIVCKTWSATCDMRHKSRDRQTACGNHHPVCAAASLALRPPFPYDARGLAHVRVKCYNNALQEEIKTLQKRKGEQNKPTTRIDFSPPKPQPASPFADSNPRQLAPLCQQPVRVQKRLPKPEYCNQSPNSVMIECMCFMMTAPAGSAQRRPRECLEASSSTQLKC
jgi:hypothetical protein